MNINQAPVLQKAGEENIKSNSIIQFHCKGTMFVELLKVVYGTSGFRGTQFDSQSSGRSKRTCYHPEKMTGRKIMQKKHRRKNLRFQIRRGNTSLEYIRTENILFVD
jgi:hypothetical protein